MREVPVSAHDSGGLCAGQRRNHLFQRAPRVMIGLTVEAQRGLADPLDCFEDVLAFLLADRFTKDSAKQPDVVAKGLVLFQGGGSVQRGGIHARAFDKTGSLHSGYRRIFRDRRDYRHHG